MADRIRGIVKWYNNLKGFGVIQGDDQKDYFLHHSNLPDDIKNISEGSHLSFSLQARPKNKGGFEAIDVKVLSLKEKSGFTSNIHPKPNRQIGQPKPSQPNKKIDDYWFQSYTHSAAQPSSTIDEEVFEVKVVGVTYEGRQAVVAQLSLGEEVLLVREPQNIHDLNAIKVTQINGQQIGYLNRHLAVKLAGKFDRYGKPVKAVITDLTGGYFQGSSLGVCIRFSVPKSQND